VALHKKMHVETSLLLKCETRCANNGAKHELMRANQELMISNNQVAIICTVRLAISLMDPNIPSHSAPPLACSFCCYVIILHCPNCWQPNLAGTEADWCDPSRFRFVLGILLKNDSWRGTSSPAYIYEDYCRLRIIPIDSIQFALLFYLSNPSPFPTLIWCSSYVLTAFEGTLSGLTNLRATLVLRAPTGSLPISLF